MTEMCPLAGRASNITSFSSTNSCAVVAILGCRVDPIAPVASNGEPEMRSLVEAPDGDQSIGSCEFSTNRAALPKATAPAPAIPTLMPVAESCDGDDDAHAARGPLRLAGTKAHDKSRNRHVNDAVNRTFAKHLRCVIVNVRANAPNAPHTDTVGSLSLHLMSSMRKSKSSRLSSFSRSSHSYISPPMTSNSSKLPEAGTKTSCRVAPRGRQGCQSDAQNIVVAITTHHLKQLLQ